MVCIYCGDKTKVVNSRLQKRSNSIWRRRKCLECGSTFTSIEEMKKQSSILIEKNAKLTPYNHDLLFISIYESCRHRLSAAEDARALTETVFSKMMPKADKGVIKTDDLKQTVIEVLSRFDRVAQVHYQAYYL